MLSLLAGLRGEIVTVYASGNRVWSGKLLATDTSDSEPFLVLRTYGNFGERSGELCLFLREVCGVHWRKLPSHLVELGERGIPRSDLVCETSRVALEAGSNQAGWRPGGLARLLGAASSRADFLLAGAPTLGGLRCALSGA